MLNHIITYPNVVSPTVCEAIGSNVLEKDMYEQGIMDIKDGKAVGSFTVNRESRYVMCGTVFQHPKLINSVIQTIVGQIVEPELQCVVKCWEHPQLLVYPENGGHYRPHIDGELKEDDVWKRVTNRHVSLLLYLDEDYTGGELTFPDYGISIRPKIGQIVAFPSNRNFLHAVMPLKSGRRRVLVSWLTVWGEECVLSDKNVIYKGQY